MDLEQKLIEIVREGTKEAFTLDHAERIAFSRFEGQLITLSVASAILKIHPNTLRDYVKYGKVYCEPRKSNQGHYFFDLSYILKLHPKELRNN